MEKKANVLFAKFDSKRKIEEAKQADVEELEELKILEGKIKSNKT